MSQGELPFRSRGGARKGAGRKPKGEVAGVEHSEREAFRAAFPLHVCMKVQKGIPSLRSRRLFREIREAIHAHPENLGVSVCHFSVQSNHLHLVVESTGKEGLSRGMQGLAIRIGRVFADRYFSRVLKTPLEVKRALAYVLENARKHGSIPFGIDPCSSGAWFDGWRASFDSATNSSSPPMPTPGNSPVTRARTWLLRIGWRRHGLIDLGAIATRH